MAVGIQVLLQVLLLEPATPAVEIGGKKLENPWAGGLQAPQFSKLQDSLLVVLDRADERLLVFRRDSQRWLWEPEADTLLPSANLRHWMLLRDENADGLPDLFTALSSGIRIFRQ
ncbi:MAG: hypothetical protein NZ580_08605, partial [Bacteroidia bacterium]|nr:hypothetical protein [Bacteroidia bacterium]